VAYQYFSSRKVRPKGPINAQVLVVGEAPGEEEDRRLQPFVGRSGDELFAQLCEARFVSSAIRYTNVVNYRPFDNDIDLAFASSKAKAAEFRATPINGRWALPVMVEGLADLNDEITLVKPKIIIAAGATALWATTGKHGIDDWRGSEIPCIQNPEITVIPIFHPSRILRVHGERYLAMHDLRRAHKVLTDGRTPRPAWNFRIRPTFQTVMECLDLCEAADVVAADIETKRLHISCLGLAWDKLNAICIPFIDFVGGRFVPYWSEEEEVAIILRLHRIFTEHKVVGQNFHYDAQYIARRMFVIPRIHFDTLLGQHVLFPGTPKSLAHNSSLYCPYHIFWKDDGKEWDPFLHPPEQLWAYNCTDCVKTFEVMEGQQALLTKYRLEPQMAEQMEQWPHTLQTMLRGVAVDLEKKAASVTELQKAIAERKTWLDTVVGRAFNPNSPSQMKLFFCDELGIKVGKGKKTKGISFDKKALAKIAEKHELLHPIIQVISEYRSLQVFLSTFALAPLDEDGRMRCSYNQGGTETFRFSSSENAFGTGTNLQNIPKGDRATTMVMPNMRELFIPDPGYDICEIDLAGADAQVVAWECDDASLKAAFRAGLKIHVVNNKQMYGALAGADGKAEPYYTRIKQGVHLTNYCGKAATMASTLNIPVAEAEKFQARWFSLHPNIPKWHTQILTELQGTRSVKNIFGFRRVYFDRIEELLAEAVAWKPQSTIGLLINRIWRRLATSKELAELEVLLQVHDSLVFQYPTARRAEYLPIIRDLVRVPIPYADPLTIALGLKQGTKSWGTTEDMKWPS
jgi:DNA polymerase I-like protein with 3'-5' exonuclease and polymerase domains/uracil-DNA glycosylase